MASILSNFGSSIVGLIRGDTKASNFFIKFAIYFVLIIAASIYNEFIILKFCVSQKYTKLFLLKEANDDIHQTNIININDNDDSSSNLN